MKSIKKTLMLLFGGVFLMTSCLPSDEMVHPLTGTWTLKGISCQNCIDKTQIGSTTYSCDDSGCNTFTFGEDGKITLVEIDGAVSKMTIGTYSISGSTVTLHLDESSAILSYTYSFVGSMLYLKEVVDENTGKCSATTVLIR